MVLEIGEQGAIARVAQQLDLNPETSTVRRVPPIAVTFVTRS
jgi:hypothetical protein